MAGGALASAGLDAVLDGAGPEHAVTAAMTATTASGRRGMRMGHLPEAAVARPEGWPGTAIGTRSSLIVRFGWLRER